MQFIYLGTIGFLSFVEKYTFVMSFSKVWGKLYVSSQSHIIESIQSELYNHRGALQIDSNLLHNFENTRAITS